jgi:hypothetical protein
LANLHTTNNELAIGANPTGAAAPNATYDGLVVDGEEASLINIRSCATGNLSYGRVAFSDDVRSRGYIDYRHRDGAGGVLEFMNFSVAGSERLRIDSDGLIIVGNSGTKFGNMKIQSFVAHGANASTSAFSAVDTTSVAAGVGGEIAFHGKYNTGAQDWAYYGHIKGAKENATAGDTACALKFFTRPNATAPIERARITSAGNFGIGDDSPAVRLEVKDNSSNNYGTTIRLSQGYNSVFSEIASNFGGSMTLNAGEGTTTAIMHFRVNNSEKMRLNNSGQLLVGTTSATSLGSHTGASNVSTFNQSGITLTQYGVTTGFYYDRLNFTNSQYFIVNSSSTGVYLGNGSTSWTAYSDERLKTNITELDGTKAYNHVKTARAASFKWNATGYPTDMKIGFIAQDWETNYPEVVNTTTETIDSVENPKGIQYTETVPVLMAALKQAISKIESFEARIATLEGS